jgi:TetR/AcrR family transcriptional regulator, transcriptional repressor for nem operon
MIAPMPTPAALKPAALTRQRILLAAFTEFYRHGFQAGSLANVVDGAGITKGALFHHFPDGKQQLGYAVVDEIIEPLLLQRWLDPFEKRADPIDVLQDSFRRFLKEDIATGNWAYGCPLNNLAQEMSPLDDGFRSRIDRLYTVWRKGFAAALSGGVRAGHVRAGVAPAPVAALLVAGQMGIWGTGKSSQNRRVMTQATDAVCDYLESMRA